MIINQGISCLIDYCRANSYIELQLVFEWINYFNNNKVNKFIKQEDFFKKNQQLIFGIMDVIEEFKNDPEVNVNLYRKLKRRMSIDFTPQK